MAKMGHNKIKEESRKLFDSKRGYVALVLKIQVVPPMNMPLNRLWKLA